MSRSRTAHTQSSSLSLHDALPIFTLKRFLAPDLVFSLGIWLSFMPTTSRPQKRRHLAKMLVRALVVLRFRIRSEEHTSELQSPCNLVCRLLLDKHTAQEPIILSLN